MSTSQQPVTLDQSELLVLKKLASIFLSEKFPGSQLEALLRARAHNSASIPTPSPTGSGSRPSVPPNILEPEPEYSRSSSSTRPSVHSEDIVEEMSRLAEDIVLSVTGAFSGLINDSTITTHSFNNNRGYGNRTETHHHPRSHAR